MPERRLRRFLHLERPRDDAAAPPARAPLADARFAGVERPPPDAPAAPTGARLERFEPAPTAEELADRRRMGEELARAVGERERRRLDAEGGLSSPAGRGALRRLLGVLLRARVSRRGW